MGVNTGGIRGWSSRLGELASDKIGSPSPSPPSMYHACSRFQVRDAKNAPLEKGIELHLDDAEHAA